MGKGHAQDGVTLLELTITVSIILISLAAGIPAMSGFQEKIRARQSIDAIRQIVSFTRLQALNSQRQTTLCPLDNNNQCSSNWNAALTVFQDTNNNRRLDTGEISLKVLRASTANETRIFNNPVISFNTRGFAGASTGSLTYCLNGHRQTGAAFIISRNGRIRLGTDKNGDGLPETPNGDNVACN